MGLFRGKFRGCLVLCLIPEVFTQLLRKIKKAPAKARGEILPMSISVGTSSGKICHMHKLPKKPPFAPHDYYLSLKPSSSHTNLDGCLNTSYL